MNTLETGLTTILHFYYRIIKQNNNFTIKFINKQNTLENTTIYSQQRKERTQSTNGNRPSTTNTPRLLIILIAEMDNRAIRILSQLLVKNLQSPLKTVSISYCIHLLWRDRGPTLILHRLCPVIEPRWSIPSSLVLTIYFGWGISVANDCVTTPNL